jgi:hypothetical protein
VKILLQSFLFQIKDHRRKQGIRYEHGHILLFAILAILSNADSYRKIQRFIVAHYQELDELFQLNWKRMPAYTTIRDIIRKTSPTELERCFREYSATLVTEPTGKLVVNCDGKQLRGSFDHFNDAKAIEILSVFASEEQIILAHEEIAQKTNEIPVAQQLMQQLGLTNAIFTFDALNCQKNA